MGLPGPQLPSVALTLVSYSVLQTFRALTQPHSSDMFGHWVLNGGLPVENRLVMTVVMICLNEEV